MRRSGAWPLLAALSLLLASRAASADPPPGAPPTAAPPAQPPVALHAPEPAEEYDASQHGGYSYGAWIKATRGTARRSTGMMATGISFIGLGAVLMATGTAVFAAGDSCNLSFITPLGQGGGSQGPLLPCGPHTAHTTGMALLAAGTIVLGIGIPLTVYGASDVPRVEAGSARLLNPPQTPSVSLHLGLRDVGVTFHF